MNPGDVPHWKKDFPIRRSVEYDVSRRQFIKVACCTALAVGAAGLARERFLPSSHTAEPRFVSRVHDIPVGGYKLFRYPTEEHPCILVRLGETEFVAYSQSCTHLMCPVNYQPERRQFHCPCHEGFFSVEDGRVLAGPPPRPLPRVKLEIREEQILAMGFEKT